jgi:hypothetical protein
MKAPSIAALISLLVTGCVTNGALQPNAAGAASVIPMTIASPTPSTIFDPAALSTQPNSLAPQIVTPVTGGPPVLAVPLGGNVFQPVTGGPPVLGVPASP